MADRFTEDKFRWLNRVCADPSVSSASVRFALAISSFWSRETDDAWPSYPTIAARMGCGTRNAQNLARGLVEAGHLVIEAGVGAGKSNRYIFVLAAPENTHPSSSFEPDENTQNSSSFRRRKNRKTSSEKHEDTCRLTIKEPFEELFEEPSERDAREKPKRISRQRRACSMPEIWPSESDIEWAEIFWQRKTRSDLSARSEEIAATARNHHLAKGTLSKDWAATWRTWALREIDFTKASLGASATGCLSAVRGIMAALELDDGD